MYVTITGHRIAFTNKQNLYCDEAIKEHEVKKKPGLFQAIKPIKELNDLQSGTN